MADRRCHYCGAPAVVLCDYAGCDRPLCGAHRRKLGHICNRQRKSLSDTIDVCLIHGDSLGYVPSRAGQVEVTTADVAPLQARATGVAAHSHDTVHGPTLGTEVGRAMHRHKMPGHQKGEGMWTLWQHNDAGAEHRHDVCVGPTSPARPSSEKQRRYVP